MIAVGAAALAREARAPAAPVHRFFYFLLPQVLVVMAEYLPVC